MIISSKIFSNNLDASIKKYEKESLILSTEYFNSNIKIIENLFNKSVKKSIENRHDFVYFDFPISFRDCGFEFKYNFSKLLEKHVEKYGYYLSENSRPIDYGLFFQIKRNK